MNKMKIAMPLAIPMTWRETKNHVDECCFCKTTIN